MTKKYKYVSLWQNSFYSVKISGVLCFPVLRFLTTSSLSVVGASNVDIRIPCRVSYFYLLKAATMLANALASSGLDNCKLYKEIFAPPCLQAA